MLRNAVRDSRTTSIPVQLRICALEVYFELENIDKADNEIDCINSILI